MHHPLPSSRSPNPGGVRNVIKVVLLAHGIGANAMSYRPNADESQWWNRRDALVRCVIAFLFCNRKDDLGGLDCSRSKELIIVFDGDRSTLSMQYIPELHQPARFVPSERAIIDLWKRATMNPGVFVEQHGLSCICTSTHSSTTLTDSIDAFQKSPAPKAAKVIGNKRDLLDYLQSSCSIDFLRRHKYVTSY
jgi:hypothetical protein